MTYICISLVIFIVSIFICIHFKKDRDTYNEKINRENEILEQKYFEINDKYNIAVNNYNAYSNKVEEVKHNLTVVQNLVEQENKIYKDVLHEEDKAKLRIDNLNSQEKIIKDKIADISLQAEQALASQKNLATSAFEEYCDRLDNDYNNKEAEYRKLNEMLAKAYDDKKEELRRDADKTAEDLEKIRSTRAAAIEALRREKEIEDNCDDYRLNISGKEVADVKLLKSIQDEINNPIVIDKIIWSNYYQPLAKIKFPKIIGKSEACGIYKLTNIITKEVYIGQSLTCCDRWKQHCKNALGVGNIATTNKLYKSMRDYGLHNFTFELLEECNASELDTKEKYYIEFFDAYNFGLNSTKGNN